MIGEMKSILSGICWPKSVIFCSIGRSLRLRKQRRLWNWFISIWINLVEISKGRIRIVSTIVSFSFKIGRIILLYERYWVQIPFFVWTCSFIEEIGRTRCFVSWIFNSCIENLLRSLHIVFVQRSQRILCNVIYGLLLIYIWVGSVVTWTSAFSTA